MVAITTSTTTGWVEKAQALSPLIAAYRDAAERDRQMPRPLFEAIRDAGLFGFWLPRRLGGPEVDIETMVRVVAELSQHDGSTGWNVMIGAEGSAFGGYLPDAGAREIYHNPRSVVAGSTQPRGRAVPVAGGYRLSGRWPMASGCTHAEWFVGGGFVMNGDATRLGSNNQPEVNLFFFPADEGRIIDTWQTSGLRGTGSHDIETADVVVPDCRRLPLMTARGQQPGALYGMSIPVLFVLPIAAVGLGIARDAIETFQQLAATKTPARTQTVLADRGSVQARAGHAATRLRAASALLFDIAGDIQAVTRSGRELTPEQAAMVGAAGAFAAETASEVVTTIVRLAGATAIYTTSRLERCLRDVNMVTQHVAVNTFNFDTAGRISLQPAA
jgi:alkylation response protein AidB-like acyl-CoA dehydrogenase